MNRKGFTLIELLAVIVLIGIIGVIAVPNVLDAVAASRKASYKMLIDNIKVAAENYYIECEYGDLSDTNKYKTNACQIYSVDENTKAINTSLEALANTGFLKYKTIKENDEKKIVIENSNKDGKNISKCKIKINKIKELDNITYTIENIDNDDSCPSTDDYNRS